MCQLTRSDKYCPWEGVHLYPHTNSIQDNVFQFLRGMVFHILTSLKLKWVLITDGSCNPFWPLDSCDIIIVPVISQCLEWKLV